MPHTYCEYPKSLFQSFWLIFCDTLLTKPQPRNNFFPSDFTHLIKFEKSENLVIAGETKDRDTALDDFPGNKFRTKITSVLLVFSTIREAPTWANPNLFSFN